MVSKGTSRQPETLSEEGILNNNRADLTRQSDVESYVAKVNQPGTHM